MDCHTITVAGALVGLGYGVSSCSKEGGLLFKSKNMIGSVIAITISLHRITKSNSRSKVYNDIRGALNANNIKHFGVVIMDSPDNVGATWGAGNIPQTQSLKPIEAGPYRTPSVLKLVPKDDGIIDD